MLRRLLYGGQDSDDEGGREAGELGSPLCLVGDPAPCLGGLDQCVPGIGLLSSECRGDGVLGRDLSSWGHCDAAGVGDGQFPHLHQELLLSDGDAVLECVGRRSELWAKAFQEIGPAVAVTGEKVSTVMGSGVVVLEHSPAGPPLVPLCGRHVHPHSGGLCYLLGFFMDGVYLLVLHL